MNIIIEVGDDIQKKQIEEELIFFSEVVTNFSPPLNISHVFLPIDFQGTVNEIQRTTNYKSSRGIDDVGVTAVAKIIEIGDGQIAVVLSPDLYTEGHDTLTRYFIFVHEVIHVINKREFPEISRDSYSRFWYSANMYTLFDEYSADRFAYHIIEDCFPTKSAFWDNFVQEQIVGFSNLIKDRIYYQHIRDEIQQFRVHADVMKFLVKIQPSFDMVAISTAHLFSISDQYPELVFRESFLDSSFVDARTLALMEYFKRKYDNIEYDLGDGLELMREYVTAFGMRFEDIEGGADCHVLDI